MIDTSAWVEYLRGTGSAADHEVGRLLGADMATTEPVVMEVLAGARNDEHLRKLRGLIGRAEMLPVLSTDYSVAASLYRTCRQHGETARTLIDCLVAAVAVRHDVAVLHADADFDVMERWTSLRIHRA